MQIISENWRDSVLIILLWNCWCQAETNGYHLSNVINSWLSPSDFCIIHKTLTGQAQPYYHPTGPRTGEDNYTVLNIVIPYFGIKYWNFHAGKSTEMKTECWNAGNWCQSRATTGLMYIFNHWGRTNYCTAGEFLLAERQSTLTCDWTPPLSKVLSPANPELLLRRKKATQLLFSEHCSVHTFTTDIRPFVDLVYFLWSNMKCQCFMSRQWPS